MEIRSQSTMRGRERPVLVFVLSAAVLLTVSAVAVALAASLDEMWTWSVVVGGHLLAWMAAVTIWCRLDPEL